VLEAVSYQKHVSRARANSRSQQRMAWEPFEYVRVWRPAGLGLKLGEAGIVASGSDGNLVGAVHVPVLVGLGAEGGGAHAGGEHMRADSLKFRAELVARVSRCAVTRCVCAWPRRQTSAR
jgi:hypothetical protein